MWRAMSARPYCALLADGVAGRAGLSGLRAWLSLAAAPRAGAGGGVGAGAGGAEPSERRFLKGTEASRAEAAVGVGLATRGGFTTGE